MIRTLLLLAILIPAAAQAGDHFDLKGVELGSTPNRDQLKAQLGIECDATMRCSSSGYTTVAGQIVKTIIARREGQLESIVLIYRPDQFDTIVEALTGKYGKPKTEHAAMQTMGGASLDDIIATWTNAAGDQISAAKYVDAVSGVATFKTKGQLDSEAARAAAAKKQI